LLATKLKPLPVPGGYFQLVDYSAVSDLRRCRVLPLADHREGRDRDPAVAVLRNAAGRASAWRGCASPRTTRRIDAALIERLQAL
jgi:methionine aminotransferase